MTYFYQFLIIARIDHKRLKIIFYHLQEMITTKTLYICLSRNRSPNTLPIIIPESIKRCFAYYFFPESITKYFAYYSSRIDYKKTLPIIFMESISNIQKYCHNLHTLAEKMLFLFLPVIACPKTSDFKTNKEKMIKYFIFN